MNKWIEILLGLLFIVAPIYLWGTNLGGFGTAAIEFLKGGLVWLVLLLGIVFLIIGISDLKD